MTEKHTAEPWRVKKLPADNVGCRTIQGPKSGTSKQAQHNAIATTVGLSRDAEDEANARRIVATVNACEGLDIKALEGGVIREMRVALEFADKWLAAGVPDEALDDYLLNETFVKTARKCRAVLTKLSGPVGKGDG
jgi:hypothetical protein